ncbi:hypothetical protein BT96DRAFT_999829 [Gymnopus androsaceus JB14]|uniref:Mediator complex subunit 16 C-terminal domain-containing protein n=1 Tax=Gymnopus androsaceus JB14 TaxID=1447944 RepID=A0A6A4H5N4_9AGAR|nr:hypothetical protein BT96DRAFT_999829 [Gymnopus androsaceus JB14]
MRVPPALLSRGLDPVLGTFTGFLAYYLYETHPRNALPQDQRLYELTVQPEVIRVFDSGMAHVTPSKPVHYDHGLYVSIYDISGTQPRRKPELTDDDTWEVAPIFSPVHRIGREVPIDAVVSPGQNLLCAIFPSPWSSQMSIQKLPRLPGSFSETSIPPLALAFIVATISNRSTDDLTHALSQPSMPPSEVAQVLYHVFTLLDRHSSGDFALELGLTIESYRSRALRSSNVHDRERADAKWHTAHDMVSVAACNAIFNDCTNGEEYQTDLVWQMIDLSSWIMSLLERLVKECVLSSDFSDPESPDSSSSSRIARALDSPMFLHLVHPTALQNLRVSLGHVKQFRNYLAGLTPRTENAQLSREVLLDLVECSGIDVSGLDAILEKLFKSVQEFNDTEVRKALASCQPSPSMQIPLREVVNSMSQSPALNKARLFIKSFEMVDGQPHIPLDHLQKDKSKDVVSKGLLLHRARGMNCLQCGGKTEYGKDHMASRSILVWEKSWARRCVCGGSWARIDS